MVDRFQNQFSPQSFVRVEHDPENLESGKTPTRKSAITEFRRIGDSGAINRSLSGAAALRKSGGFGGLATSVQLDSTNPNVLHGVMKKETDEVLKLKKQVSQPFKIR